MLTPEQLAYCADDILQLYAKLDESIVRDIARRIAKEGKVTETGKWQINALQGVGMLHTDILKTVSKYTSLTEDKLKQLFEDAAVEATEYDMMIYQISGLSPLPVNMSPSAMQILEAGYNKTNGNIQNLTKTTAVTSQVSFIDACSLAELQVTSGAFDYNTAIRRAIETVAIKGSTVLYPSGHIDKLDVAVRRNVMTGIGQTTGEICLNYAKELQWDLMEITAHAGARPSHAEWQGQIVSLSGKAGYLTLSDIGYGTGDGFKGWNCRHDWYPYYEGSTRMYSKKDLEALEDRDIEYPDGTMHTLYEAEQKQRYYERKIRETKRILVAQDEFIKNASSEVTARAMQLNFNEHAVELKKQESELKEFCNKTGLLIDNARIQKYGFGKSLAQSTLNINKKHFTKPFKDVILNEIGNKYIKITDDIINKIRLPNINILDEEQKANLQQSLIELLSFAKNQDLGTEVSMGLNYMFKEIPNSRLIGKKGSVNIKNQMIDFYGLHNHPSNSRLSIPDIISFLPNKYMHGIIAYGNGNSGYIIKAQEKSNRFGYMKYIMDKSKENLPCGVSYETIYKNRNNKNFYKQFNLNKNQVIEDVEKLTYNFLRKAESYGFKYIEF